MSNNSISNTSSGSSDEAKGRLLMIALSILAVMPLIIGFWASQTGGAL
jgi:hypothetical protein